MLVALVLLAVQAGAAQPPAGPRLAAIQMIERGGFKNPRLDPDPSMALSIVDPSTGGEQRYLRGKMDARGRVVPIPFGAPSWSLDGSLIAFGAHDGRARKDRIYVVSADGTGLRAIAGTDGGAHPVLSPDGHTLAFSRSRYRTHVDPDLFTNPSKTFDSGKGLVQTYSSETTWIVDLAAGKPRRLTPWKNGLHNSPTSFAPDGSALLLTREDGDDASPRVMRLNLADGASQAVVERSKEAVYSPDGSRIAFVGFLHPDLVEAEENRDYLAEELYVANADGSGVKRLSRTAGVLENSPSWDPSGQRLAYVQYRADTSFTPGLGLLFPTGNALMQVNADGSCRRKILARPGLAFYGVAWQPGAGREAGPISC